MSGPVELSAAGVHAVQPEPFRAIVALGQAAFAGKLFFAARTLVQ
jgi:hypothetical protein